jgi:hypothetical protein
MDGPPADTSQSGPRPRSYQVTPAILGGDGRHNHRQSKPKADTRLKSQPAAERGSTDRVGRHRPPRATLSLSQAYRTAGNEEVTQLRRRYPQRRWGDPERAAPDNQTQTQWWARPPASCLHGHLAARPRRTCFVRRGGRLGRPDRRRSLAREAVGFRRCRPDGLRPFGDGSELHHCGS